MASLGTAKFPLQSTHPAIGFLLLGFEFSEDLRANGVDDVFGLIEQFGDALCFRLWWRRRNDQRTVVPVDVHQPSLIARTVLGTAPRCFGG